MLKTHLYPACDRGGRASRNINEYVIFTNRTQKLYTVWQ